ncbi:MAG: hypothetical protein E6248_06640 [Clostridium sp.]|uniref:DUF4179 domain-containing protein n=1 Tax=Clostridium sp. TaxID=1506 RepID=UPI0029086EE8|nr:hypothetical protein [Clostridium sp.]MDU5110107.1 hypothetical protein [Clostridium sp.]
MMDLDKELKNLKEEGIKAPDNFEELMRGALNKNNIENERIEIKKRLNFNNKYLRIALILMAFIFVFNFNSVSAMIKKLIGYESYFSYYSYVEKLNESGELQEVNEKLKFKNGKEVTIEAVVYDNKYVSVFMKGNINYIEKFVPTDDIPEDELSENRTSEEFEDISSKSNIEVLDGEIASGSSVYSEKNGNGDTLCVQIFKVGENKDEFNLRFTEDGESKEVTIDIDNSKIVEVKNIKPEENKIEIDGVKFIVNNLRVSPLAINLDYSVVSDDEDKVKAIQVNNGNFFNEGIHLIPSIEGENIERMGIFGAYDEKEVLDNGIRLVENFVLKDLAIDKFNKAKIVIVRANFSEDLNLDTDSSIKDTWINDNLFLEELSYDEETETYDIAYWSKYKTIWFEKYLPYEIIPYDGLISFEPSVHQSNIDDYLGKDFRKYIFMRRQLYIGEGKKFFIINNKALDISKKDRTIKVKIDY